MSRVENQRRLFLELTEELRPLWRRDPGQPQRLAAWLVRHRAGSRDRRLYRELVYTLWRILPWVEDADSATLIARIAQYATPSPATAAFIAAFADPAATPPAPAASLLPPWFLDQCPALAEHNAAAALLSRAPLWVRRQGGSATEIAQALTAAGMPPEPSPVIPTAWRLPPDSRVTDTPVYRSGAIEIQDIGSQALLHSIPTLPAGRWLDACAGAGGKTLQLAAMLGPAAPHEIVAHDSRPAALQELEVRRQRAGIDHITISRDPTGTFAGVLVDAPCSGSGTWRRAPHLKWTTTPDGLERCAEKQLLLLARFARKVAGGGLLIYVTCSLCRTENDEVAATFEAQHPEFVPTPLRHPASGVILPVGRFTLLPHELDSDGYFVAAWRRR